jgi:heme-degrading monooxygenase HmoA
MYVVVWSYRVASGRERDFEALYAADGEWSRLFAGSPDYLGTQLLRDVDDPSRYVTLDRWRTREDYEAFLQVMHEDYAALDRRGDALTDAEVRNGVIHGCPSERPTSALQDTGPSIARSEQVGWVGAINPALFPPIRMLG